MKFEVTLIVVVAVHVHILKMLAEVAKLVVSIE